MAIDGKTIVAEWTSKRRFRVEGIKYTVESRVTITLNAKFHCMRDYEADFHIRRTGRPETQEHLGKTTACDVWKGRLWKKSGKPMRKDELLTTPAGYTGDIRLHGGSEDPISDKKKAFLIAFNQDGTPKRSLPSDARKALQSDRIHYILSFELAKDFRGGGRFSTQTLFCYEQALREPDLGDMGLYEGCLILCPALLLRSTDAMRAAGAHIGDWDSTQESLRCSYVWLGVDTWVEPAVGLESAIMILGKVISSKLDDDQTATPGKDRAIRDVNVRKEATQGKPPTLMSSRTYGSYIWYDGATHHIYADTSPLVIDEARLQQQMWREKQKQDQTGIDPHDRGRWIKEWIVKGIMGEREGMYLVDWGDILLEGRRYRLPPTWKLPEEVPADTIKEWDMMADEQRKMGRREKVGVSELGVEQKVKMTKATEVLAASQSTAGAGGMDEEIEDEHVSSDEDSEDEDGSGDPMDVDYED